MQKRNFALQVLCFLFCCQTSGQVFLQLKIDSADVALFEKTTKRFHPKPEKASPGIFQIGQPDSAAASQTAARLLQLFHKKSFLAASLDPLENPGGNPFSFKFYLGPKFHWLEIRDPTPKIVGRDANNGQITNSDSARPPKKQTTKPQNPKPQTSAPPSGYPFAAFWFDSIEIRADGGVSATAQFAENQYFAFSIIQNRGDVRLPARWLSAYLGIRPGEPYDREKILKIRERLREIPFLEMTANPSVTFAGGEATVNLFLAKKKASRFDFVVGLLPNSETSDGKLLLTGNLNAAFQNALSLGERFSIELERFRPETQRLDVQAVVPYLLGSNFGVDARLNIFRRDSTWVDAIGEAGVQYLFPGADFLRVFWENRSTFLQKVDTAAVAASRRLPQNLDFRQNGFGLETRFQRLDYRFNPRRGWAISAKGLAGFNRVLRNSQIENLRDPEDASFSFSTLYDSLAERVARFRAEFGSEIFLPIFQRSTLKIALRGGAIFSPDRPVFANEQYRLGGNKLMRGFDEESLFATRWAVGTLEYRLLIGQNAWLSAFSDFGYLENFTDRARQMLSPVGIGSGMTFETKAGIFGLSLAVGRLNSDGFDFRAAKFHIGYVSLF